MPCYDVQTSRPKRKLEVSKTTKPFTVALIGNPNVGKTSLFNALTGFNSQTANFSGTTVERKIGRMKPGKLSVEILDLPGIYSLKPSTPEERIACDMVGGHAADVQQPDVLMVVLDATNIERGLFLVSQVFEYQLPVIVALNMTDVAQRKGIIIDVEKLALELGCPVVPTVARTGRGVDDLTRWVRQMSQSDDLVLPYTRNSPRLSCSGCSGCPFQARYAWSENVASRCVQTPPIARGQRTEMIDKVLTHPVAGVVAFLAVMFSVFYLIFSVANIPMDLIDGLFARIGVFIAGLIPAGKIQSLIVDGIIGGVGGMLVFLPQICILFFFLALLEDSGYMARAAFVMDRLMRKIGLPGTAFVPLLSAHACAIPAIMATRVIHDTRDRLVTILVAPLMSCSARIPVYAMVTALLFPNHPGRAAIVFTGAYMLGMTVAIAMAFLFKKTILRGESKPLVLELPNYRIPSLNTACIYTWERGKVFVQQAGTVILGISIVLWVLATFPESNPPADALKLKKQAEILAAQGQVEQASNWNAQAEIISSHHTLSNSFAGRLGKLVEPVVRPLGFDWQIGIGIISSFAAREVIVSTLAIVYGVGSDSADDEPSGLYETLREAQRSNGTPVFTTATSVSLLVFYVLAMQCLPTQAVTRRETNSVKWTVFQLGYMTVLAYTASFITFHLVSAFG